MPRSLYDEMIAHARAVSPHEAVGLLGGSDGCVQRRIPLLNVLGGKHFLADPLVQFHALRELSAAGLQPLAVYHSHPGGGVDLSDEDLRFASPLPYLQLVIALDRPHDAAEEITAWAVSNGEVAETFLDVVDD